MPDRRQSTIRISFTGDISLNNLYNTYATEGINPFSDISDSFKDSDYVIGNLEAMIESSDENEQKVTKLKASKSAIQLLSKLPLSLVTLANNHVYDQGFDGFKKTIEFLNTNNINFIGAKIKSESLEDYTFILKQRKFVVLNYVHTSTNPRFPENIKVDVNIYDTKLIIGRIKYFKQEGLEVILILHWGDDNVRYPNPNQRKEAKSFIDAGADLIVGHHSHVLQGYEVYRGKYIYYSLGNFAFASIKKSEDIDVNRQAKSVILHCDFQEDSIKVEYTPIKLVKSILVKDNKTNIKKLSKRIPLISNSVVWPFYRFYVFKVYKVYFYFFGNDRSILKQLKKLKLEHIKRLLKKS